MTSGLSSMGMIRLMLWDVWRTIGFIRELTLWHRYQSLPVVLG